jgi:peptidoglycan/LPS O-acetylase OafA/YrhL
MKKIESLESLRGLMALWVFLGHLALALGVKAPGPLQNGYAVDVFIILSGFVIFLLLDQRSMSYGAFIKRRAWRLFPVYLIVLGVAAATLDQQLAAVTESPFGGERNEARVAILQASIENFWQHLIVHLVLLQGMVPQSVLPYSDFAFVGQAWSISLEWQFYLLAPLVLSCFSRRPYMIVGLVVALVALAQRGGFGFLPDHSWLFGVGIASFYLWKHRSTAPHLHTVALGAVCLALLARSIPLLVWFAVFGALLTPDAPASRMIQRTLSISSLRILGQISYPIYMSHMLVIYFAMWGLNGLGFTPVNYAVAFSLISIAGTLAVSYLLHVAVEAPCMKLGARGVHATAAAKPMRA